MVMDLSKVRVINNPVVLLNLCTMRDKNTDRENILRNDGKDAHRCDFNKSGRK